MPHKPDAPNHTDSKTERLAEATSDETLQDIRSSEELPTQDRTARNPNSMPAPDSGTTTSDGFGREDGSNVGDPM